MELRKILFNALKIGGNAIFPMQESLGNSRGVVGDALASQFYQPIISPLAHSAVQKVHEAYSKPSPTENAPSQQYSPQITIPYSKGGDYTLPAPLAQILLNAFNDIGQATNSARVLNHPADNPYLPGDPSSVNHINYGENASFKLSHADTLNTDGSIDRGLFRVNSNSFNGIMEHPFFGKMAREKFNIHNWQDMEDPQKNAYMAKLIYERNSGWRGWFAAPKELRAQGKPDLKKLANMIRG